MNIGVNLFGVKRELYHDFDGTLKKLWESGIHSVEICVAFTGGGEPPKELKLDISKEALREMKGGIWDYDDAAEKLAKVRRAGMTVVSCHVMVGSPRPELLPRLLPKLLDFARENQVKYYVISLMQDLGGMKEYGAVLREMSEALALEEVTLCYHNHEMECMDQEGTTALDYILEQCPSLKLELDVGWAKFPGTDPVEWMKKYRDRMVLLHFKDIRADACPKNRDSCFTAVGEGSIPLGEILREAGNCPLDAYGLIIDQDDSPTDILEDLARGAANIRGAVQP